jgi:F-type H+-transporting ATPase subunit b
VLINWFTVGAQIVNFLILMVLLKIFLYDRVIGAMDEREKKIASRLEEAEQKHSRAEEKRKEVNAAQKEIEQKRQKLMSEAEESAGKKRQALEEQARSEFEELRERWRRALDRQKESFARNLREKACRQVLEVTRRVLEDMADEDLQDRLVQSFADRLGRLADDEKAELARSLDEKNPQARVQSAFELSSADRRRLTDLLRNEVHPELEVEYRTDADLLGGIELQTPGRKVSWSMGSYLEELEENLLQALDEASRRPKAAQKDHGEDAGGSRAEKRDAEEKENSGK